MHDRPDFRRLPAVLFDRGFPREPFARRGDGAILEVGGRMSKVDFRNIEKIAGRCGGRAVVAGTRIRVSIIVGCHRQGKTVEDIVAMYPHLRAADIHDALAYAYDHPDEITRDLADDDEQAAQDLWPGGPGQAALNA